MLILTHFLFCFVLHQTSRLSKKFKKEMFVENGVLSTHLHLEEVKLNQIKVPPNAIIHCNRFTSSPENDSLEIFFE